MNEPRRVAYCLLSVALSCGVFWLVGGANLPAKLKLHRWYPDVAVIFLGAFSAMMIIALRGRFVTSAWPALLCVPLGYISAPIAYITYFALFESELLSKTLSRIPLTEFIPIAFLLASLASLSWLFGGLAGALFILLRYVFEEPSA